MTDSDQALRLCPTRIDGTPVLFAHKVNGEQCQDRQRGRYHKCFTCRFNNAWQGSDASAPAKLEPIANSLSQLVERARDEVRVG